MQNWCLPLCDEKLYKLMQKYASGRKKMQRRGTAMHGTLLQSITTTVILLHNWPLFLWVLITFAIIKLGNVVIIKTI